MTTKRNDCYECAHSMAFHNDRGCAIEKCVCTVTRSMKAPDLDIRMDKAA